MDALAASSSAAPGATALLPSLWSQSQESEGTGDSGVTDTGAEADATSDTESDAGGSADATTDTEPSTDTTADTSTDNCPDELFVQADPAPENSAYPDPSLRAYCDADYLNVESNGIIGYQFVPITPNAEASVAVASPA